MILLILCRELGRRTVLERAMRPAVEALDEGILDRLAGRMKSGKPPDAPEPSKSYGPLVPSSLRRTTESGFVVV